MSRNALTRLASFFLFLHDRSAKTFSFRITSFCVPLLLRALSLDGAWKNKKERWKNRKNLRKVAKCDAVLRCEQANFMQIFRRRLRRSATCALFNAAARISFDSVFTQFQNFVRFSEKKFFGRTEEKKRRRRKNTANDDDGWINNFFVNICRFLCARRECERHAKCSLSVTKVTFYGRRHRRGC